MAELWKHHRLKGTDRDLYREETVVDDQKPNGGFLTSVWMSNRNGVPMGKDAYKQLGPGEGTKR